MSSFPSMHASDCMNVSMSSRYLWGKFPLPWRLVNKRCPNFHSDFMATTVKYAAAGGDDYAAAAVAPYVDLDVDSHIDVDTVAHIDVDLDVGDHIVVDTHVDSHIDVNGHDDIDVDVATDDN